MKNTVSKHAHKMGFKAFNLVMVSTIMLLSSGCEISDSDGDITNSTALPTEFSLNLHCPDVAINTETCILNDPENPFARSAINDETKWELEADSPSAKSSFYLWGTALAKSPQGENQYFAAKALHQLYTQGGSEVAREQAKRAYRSVLDNFFNAFTFYEIEMPGDNVLISAVLSELVGESLYDPIDLNLAPLYDSEVFALDAMASWGYAYDTQSETVTSNH